MQADRILLRFLLILERRLYDKESECLLYRLPKTRGFAVFFGFPPVSYPMLALSMEGYNVLAYFEEKQDARAAEMFFSLYYQDIAVMQKKELPCMPKLLVLVDIPEGQGLPTWLLEKKELLRKDCIRANGHYYIKAWEMN